jgi:methionyl-tRNA synthetase
MTARPQFYLTTAIDYPNARPHIGHAFEKIGADVQARYRRMAGFEVCFLIGNDENTVKVARRAAELGQETKAYCDEMARQFKEVWAALDISYDDFIQTSEPRHHQGCRHFIQKVYDNGYIYKGSYEGLYCEGCEAFKTEKDLVDGLCPNHRRAPVPRSEPGYYFAFSKFQQRLLDFYAEHPDFIQPQSRRNEVVNFVQSGLQDTLISRHGETWGIRIPFDEEFTIYVWFDALLNYMTAIGYGHDEATWSKWWPADLHFIGKDITRFHCALWPAMLMAAGLPLPRRVFGHGFVHRRDDRTGELVKESKTLGNVTEPMELITKFSSEGFRFYFMRECPFPGDGEFSWQRFAEVYNSDLANNLGNLFSRVTTLVLKNYAGTLPAQSDALGVLPPEGWSPEELAAKVTAHVEACEYHLALEAVWRQNLDPANRMADQYEPWKLVKTDPAKAAVVLRHMVEALRRAAIYLKPFLPRSAERIYRSFDFGTAWEEVRYADAASALPTDRPLRLTAAVDEKGKVAPLFPRIS